MMPTTHAIYLILSVAAVIWVAITLRRRGKFFLMNRYDDNAEMADSFSHLLSVGFYLVQVGCVLLTLRYGGEASNSTELIEVISTKIGLVLVVLAISHFCHVLFFAKSGRNRGTYVSHVSQAAVDAEVIDA